MKKIMIVLTVIAAMFVPAAAYATQSVAEDFEKKVQNVSEYNSDNHKYRQQLWLDSSEDEHGKGPELWL